MALTAATKEQVNKMIFERAYEIEQTLSENDFFEAKIYGLKPEQVSETAMKIAIQEIKKEFQN